MRIELDLAQLSDWAAGLPTWAVALIVVKAWYLGAGLYVRWLTRKDDGPTVGRDRFALWVFSPILIPALLAWTTLWVSSVGCVKAPWKV